MCYHIVLEGTNKCPGEYYTQAELHKLLKYKYLVVTELHTHIGTEGIILPTKTPVVLPT